MEFSAWTCEALPKTILYTALLPLVGTVAVHLMLGAFRRASPPDSTLDELESALARIAFVASNLALAALFARAFGHTVTVFGPSDALKWSNLRVIAIESRWGQAWRLQILAAGALVLCAFSIRLSRRAGWFLCSIAAVSFCAVIPRLGHGATTNGHLVLHVLHLAGVSAWLGSLTVMVWLYFRKWNHGGASHIREILIVLLQRFSSIALPAAGVAVLTGVIAAALYLGSFSNLIATSYGRTLLLKIGGVAGVMACGWSNWRRMRTGRAPRTRTLIAELVFAAAVVVVTGILTETDHP